MSGIGGTRPNAKRVGTRGANRQTPQTPKTDPGTEPEDKAVVGETPVELADAVRARDATFSDYIKKGKMMIRSNMFASESDQRRVVDMVCKYAYIGLIRKYDQSVGSSIRALESGNDLPMTTFSGTNTYADRALSPSVGQEAITKKTQNSGERARHFPAAVSFYRFITQSFMFVDWKETLTFDELHKAVKASPKFAFNDDAVRTSSLYYPVKDSNGKITVAKIALTASGVTDAVKEDYLKKMNAFISADGNQFVLACMLAAGQKGRLKAYRSAMGKLLTFARKHYRQQAEGQISKGRGRSGDQADGNLSEKAVEAYRKKKFVKEYIERSLRGALNDDRTLKVGPFISSLSAPSGLGDSGEFADAIKKINLGDSVDGSESVAEVVRAVSRDLSAYVGPSPNTRGKPSSMEAHAAHFKSEHKLTPKSMADSDLKPNAVLFGYIPVCDRNDLLSYIFPTGKNMGTVRRKSTNEMYAEIRTNSQVLSVMNGNDVASANRVMSMDDSLESVAEAFRNDAAARKKMLGRYSAAKKAYLQQTGNRSMPYWWAHVSGVQPSIKHRRAMHSSMKRYAEAVGDSIFPPSVMKSAMKHCLARHAFGRQRDKAHDSRGLPTMADGAVDTMQGISMQFIKELGRVVELYTAGDDKKRKTCASKSKSATSVGGVDIGGRANLRRCTTTSVPTQPPAVGMAVMSLLCGSTVAYDAGALHLAEKRTSEKAEALRKLLSAAREKGRSLTGPMKVNLEKQSKANRDVLEAIIKAQKVERRMATKESKGSRRKRLLNGLNGEVSQALSKMLISEGHYYLEKRAHDNEVVYEPCGMMTKSFSTLLAHTDTANELLRIQKKDLSSANVVDEVKSIVNTQLTDTELRIDGADDMLPYIGVFYAKDAPLDKPKREKSTTSKRDHSYRPLTKLDFNFKSMTTGETNAHNLPRQDLKGTFFSIALIKRVMLKNTNVRLSNRAAMVVAVAITSLVETLMAVFYDGWDGAKRHKMYPADLVAGLLAGGADAEDTRDASLADRLAIFALLKRLKCSLVTATEDFTDVPDQFVRAFSVPGRLSGSEKSEYPRPAAAAASEDEDSAAETESTGDDDDGEE